MRNDIVGIYIGDFRRRARQKTSWVLSRHRYAGLRLLAGWLGEDTWVTEESAVISYGGEYL